jgi:hypothetical protein
VKDSTAKTWLASLSDNAIKTLITKAQDIIDTYIRTYWTKFSETQEYIFPIDVVWVSTLPSDIKIACLYCVEQLFESGDLIKTATWWEVISEKAGDRSINYSEWNKNTLDILWIPVQAKAILDKYRNIFFKNVI